MSALPKGLKLDDLADGQTCERCMRPLNRHFITKLGAVRCYDLAVSAGLTPWREHQLKTKDGKPFLSLLERIGQLAAMLEEEGLPRGYERAVQQLNEIEEWLVKLSLADNEVEERKP